MIKRRNTDTRGKSGSRFCAAWHQQQFSSPLAMKVCIFSLLYIYDDAMHTSLAQSSSYNNNYNRARASTKTIINVNNQLPNITRCWSFAHEPLSKSRFLLLTVIKFITTAALRAHIHSRGLLLLFYWIFYIKKKNRYKVKKK